MIVNPFYVQFLVELVFYLNWYCKTKSTLLWLDSLLHKQDKVYDGSLNEAGAGMFTQNKRFAFCAITHHTVTTQCHSDANWHFDIQIKKLAECSVLGRRPDLSLVCYMFRSSWAVIKAFLTVKREVHKVNSA